MIVICLVFMRWRPVRMTCLILMASVQINHKANIYSPRASFMRVLFRPMNTKARYNVLIIQIL